MPEKFVVIDCLGGSKNDTITVRVGAIVSIYQPSKEAGVTTVRMADGSKFTTSLTPEQVCSKISG